MTLKLANYYIRGKYNKYLDRSVDLYEHEGCNYVDIKATRNWDFDEISVDPHIDWRTGPHGDVNEVYEVCMACCLVVFGHSNNVFDSSMSELEVIWDGTGLDVAVDDAVKSKSEVVPDQTSIQGTQSKWT